jgi:PmbA protein
VHWSATISSRHGVVMTAIAGDGTGMERDYEFSSALHAADLAIWIRQF